MAMWHEVKIRYDKMNENGAVKKVTESYLLDSLTCTEAEAKAIEKVSPFISGEYTVSSVKKTSVAEVFFDEREYSDKWYAVKAGFVQLDEKSGKEKVAASLFMVQAPDFDGAVDGFKEAIKTTLADWRIVSVTETQIMDVFKYEPDSQAVDKGADR